MHHLHHHHPHHTMQQPIELIFKRSGKTHDIKLPPDATVLDLKKAIELITNIKPENQNLLGVSPPKGPPPKDHEKLITYNLRKKQPIMMLQIVDQYKKHKPNHQPQSSVPPILQATPTASSSTSSTTSTTSTSSTPNTPADKIASIQGKLDDLTLQVDELGTQFSENGARYTEEDSKVLRTTLNRQTEFLTQTLISLDSIDAASERDKRREQVKRILTIQEKIDAIKSKL